MKKKIKISFKNKSLDLSVCDHFKNWMDQIEQDKKVNEEIYPKVSIKGNVVNLVFETKEEMCDFLNSK